MTDGLAQVPRVPGAPLTHTMVVLDGLGTLAFALTDGLLGVWCAGSAPTVRRVHPRRPPRRS